MVRVVGSGWVGVAFLYTWWDGLSSLSAMHHPSACASPSVETHMWHVLTWGPHGGRCWWDFGAPVVCSVDWAVGCVSLLRGVVGCVVPMDTVASRAADLGVSVVLCRRGPCGDERGGRRDFCRDSACQLLIPRSLLLCVPCVPHWVDACSPFGGACLFLADTRVLPLPALVRGLGGKQ